MINSQEPKIGILIPAYKPVWKLVALIDDLYANGQKNIIVVNDGSGKEFEQPI